MKSSAPSANSGIGYRCSPAISSGTRDVAKIRNDPAERAVRPRRSRTSLSTCSQLSTTRTLRRCRRRIGECSRDARRCPGRRAGCVARPSPRANASSTCAGDRAPARSTNPHLPGFADPGSHVNGEPRLARAADAVERHQSADSEVASAIAVGFSVPSDEVGGLLRQRFHLCVEHELGAQQPLLDAMSAASRTRPRFDNKRRAALNRADGLRPLAGL